MICGAKTDSYRCQRQAHPTSRSSEELSGGRRFKPRFFRFAQRHSANHRFVSQSPVRTLSWRSKAGKRPQRNRARSAAGLPYVHRQTSFRIRAVRKFNWAWPSHPEASRPLPSDEPCAQPIFRRRVRRVRLRDVHRRARHRDAAPGRTASPPAALVRLGRRLPAVPADESVGSVAASAVSKATRWRIPPQLHGASAG